MFSIIMELMPCTIFPVHGRKNSLLSPVTIFTYFFRRAPWLNCEHRATFHSLDFRDQQYRKIGLFASLSVFSSQISALFLIVCSSGKTTYFTRCTDIRTRPCLTLPEQDGGEEAEHCDGADGGAAQVHHHLPPRLGLRCFTLFFGDPLELPLFF